VRHPKSFLLLLPLRRLAWLVALLLIIATPSAARAQLWSGILDRSRAVDWSQAGVVSSIPNRTTRCATLSPGATHTQINNALAACPANQVVFLNAGTYNLSGGIDFMAAGVRNVTLRGAGPDRTFLVVTGGGAACGGMSANICVRGSSGNWQGEPRGTANWTAGFTQGTTQITLSSVGGLSVGQIIVLDQLDDASPSASGPFVTGACAYQTGGCENMGRDGNRAQTQLVAIQAINGNVVTISPGLHMTNWSASKSPGVWWWGGITETAVKDGIEDLSIDHSGSPALTGIALRNGYNCWVKNVRSINSNRDHVWLNGCAHCEVRDSYFFGTQRAVSTSYGVELFPASDSLVLNNIFQQITSPHLEGQSSGNVTAYNFMIYMYQQLSPTFMFLGDAATHHGAAAMNLREGQVGNGLVYDLNHGTSNLLTVFRSRYLGTDTGAIENTIPIEMNSFHRYNNFIGNVLGTPGYHNNYEYSNGPLGLKLTLARSIFELGFTRCCGGFSAGLDFDAASISTLYRWGNFDYATNTSRWNASEVPAGQPIPNSHSLPPSFFLSAKPAWFGSVPFPPIGPDVSGNAHDIPAKRCYLNVMRGPADGTGSPLTFNANSCYGSSASVSPNPPQGLSVQ